MHKYEDVYEATLKYFNGDTLATDAWIKKYCLQDKNENYLELTPDDMHWRLANEFARIEQNYPNPLSAEEIYGHLKGFTNLVLQGSPMYGIGNDHTLSSLSNCVVAPSPEDSISGIFNTAKDIANLYKARIGIGFSVSSLRPEGAAVNNSAKTSTGAWSFVDFYSHVTALIGQSGRRGALLEAMDVRHPDIFKFATCKQDPVKVTGANISVQISDEFIKAVLEDSKFELRWPVDSLTPQFKEMINARDLWKVIVESATNTADPGLLFWDTICDNLPAHCYKEFKTLSTNACSEIPSSAFDSCRLLSINLYGFICNPHKQDAYFNYQSFQSLEN